MRRTFDALGLPVSRLMRVRFGLINLPPRLKRGMTAEMGEGEVAQVLEWAGLAPDSENVPEVSLPTTKTGRMQPVKGTRSADAAKTVRHRRGIRANS